MATYIPGVTDYIPQIQPFQPDYNFLGNIMQTRQSRYDASHKQLSSVYGTLLNSPMTRDENINKRDQFFKSVDGDIKRMSGLDLSLKQNQEAAMQVFKPFYEDKDMVKDMVWTKNYHNELQRAEGFKYCVDPDKCGGQYWQGGVEALQYRAEEFKNASKDEALNFSNASFTPLVNVMDKAMKSAKDAGFKVSFDSVQGGYIVTDKNGERMVAPLKSFFLSKFGGDPAVMDYYKTQAYIQRKQFTRQNAIAMGGEDKATLAYMNNVYQHVTESIDKAHAKASQDHDRVGIFKTGLEQKVKRDGALASDKSLFDMYNSITEQEATTAQTKEITKTASDNLAATKNFTNNAKMVGDHLDQLMGFAMLDKEVGNAAKAYADLTSERDIKADPYSLAAYSSNLDYQKQVKLKGLDLNIWKEKEIYKAKQEHAKFERAYQGVFNGDLPGSKGQATGVIDEDMALKANQGALTDSYRKQQGQSIKFVADLANALRTQYEVSAKDPTKQNVLSATSEIIFKGTGIDGKKIANGDAKELAKLQTMDIGAAGKAYEQAIKTIDPTGGVTGELNSDWGREFWNKTAAERNEIKNTDALRKERIKFNEEQSKNVTNAVVADLIQKDPQAGKQKADLAASMAELNYNGFLPVLTPGSESANNVAHDYANNHQADFGNWQAAYNFATTNMQEVATEWYNGYKNHAVAFNQADGFGKVSNAKMGGGYTYTYDSRVPHDNSTRLAEVMNNTKNIGDNAIIQFGDAGTINGSDPAAKAVWEQFYNDFMNIDPKHPDKNAPKGTYSISRIAGGDENYMGYTIYPDEGWAGKYRGSEKLPGITRGLTAGAPITVFIPKDKANNSYYRDTEFNDYDFLLQRQGKLVLDDYPEGGRISIDKVGNQIQIHGKLIAVNEKGEEEFLSVSKVENNDLDARTLFTTFNNQLGNLAQWNAAQKDAARKQHGVKNFQELQKLISQTGLQVQQ